jgi:hypothetical protein
MASESPEQTRRMQRRRPNITTEEMYELEEQRRELEEQRRQQRPPSDEGPERRNREGVMDRALVQRFKNGGCVMAGRGGKFKGSM